MNAGDRFRGVVALHLFLRRGETLRLLRRFNTVFVAGIYSGIAGPFDGGETVLAAMVRQTWELAVNFRLDQAIRHLW